jgi:hypothetical protein
MAEKAVVNTIICGIDRGNDQMNDQTEAHEDRGALRRLWAWCRRNPAVAALVMQTIVLLIVFFVWSTFMAVGMVKLRLENDELRRELDSLRKATPQQRAVPGEIK